MRGSCIVNVSFVSPFDKSNWFVGGQMRLAEFMRRFANSDYLFYESEAEVGAPSHAENPYAFKVYAIKKAIEDGYRYIFWVDSSIFPVKSIKPVWDIIQNQGYLFIQNSFRVGEWVSDSVLDMFKLSRDSAFAMESIYGGIFGLDMQNEKANIFFSELWQAMESGAFKGEWDNNSGSVSSDTRVKGHRHDQAVMSILAYKHGMTNFTNNILKSYTQWPGLVDDNIILIYKRGL